MSPVVTVELYHLGEVSLPREYIFYSDKTRNHQCSIGNDVLRQDGCDPSSRSLPHSSVAVDLRDHGLNAFLDFLNPYSLFVGE